MTAKKDIRAIDIEELIQFFTSHGDKPFRAKQVDEWIWKKSARSFDEMTNLSLKTRALLSEHFVINGITIGESQKSKDGTIKNAFRLYDRHIIEGVLIPTKTRMTACVSSQVGCSLSCKFCGTGRLKRERNLNADEIFDQVSIINQEAIGRTIISNTPAKNKYDSFHENTTKTVQKLSNRRS